MVVAAPSSGSGKTTVATGLMAAFAARGLAVSPHKVGPDYIDPGYHALATGRPGRNLDPWLTSEDLVVPLFRHAAAGADLAVVEGVMGLYDGAQGPARPRGGGDFASTAHVASLLDAPVVLVVDASAAAGRSVAALVHGFRSFGDVRVGGVVLNRLGSDGHELMCREAVEELGLPVLGALRRHEAAATPSRHLGLVPAAERRADAVATVARLGELVASSCDLDAVLALAGSAPPLAVAPWEPDAHLPADADGVIGSRGGRPRIAVAGGPAFTFGYAENEELLEAAGAEVVRFDPLHDENLPDGTGGVVIGGGFPEMYAADLSANEPLRRALAAFAGAPDTAGRAGPVYAECAGLLYLAEELDGEPMCGVLPGVTATMAPRLTLGYRAAVAVSDSVVARVGERVHGHEFHRTVTEPGHGTTPAWQWSTSGPEGFVRGDCVASYLHLHWAGTPQFATRMVEACRTHRGERV
ncbi:cobyrinate a,c-diamide synthase [Spirillospora sp. NBC_01491]|uniref:cobyrinate a,c-diamide synthase n=1 Tax=Spirillospora sp. NBC_01491 TaxID=2976007 RepID=UPI00255AA357|nr:MULTISPECIES: cobyrinate a,c-diamide synthase [Thermomonosporaceae]MDL4777499.1 cobyrinate a,c-diamide synthase [Actinomadura xylanilytica]